MKFCPKCGKRLRLLTGKMRGQALCPSCGTRVSDAGAVEAPQVEAARTSLVTSFPYGSMRPYQRDVLDQIDAALSSGKKFIILEAPVGFGKSAVAAALCRNLRSAYVLTSTKQLQEQYSADFGFTTVMGKSNFTCLVPTSSGRLVACSKGRCEADWSLSECPHYLSFDQYEDHLKGLCDKKESKCEQAFRKEGGAKLCTYYKQKWDSFRQNVTVGNYAFFFSELRYTEDVRKRKLLVCDEAHDLERQLVGFASFVLKASTIRQYPSGKEDGEFAVPYEEGMDGHAEDWLKALAVARGSLQGFMDTNDGKLDMQDKLISCRGTLDSLEGFIDELKAAPENWIVSGMRKTSLIDGSTVVDEVTFQPLEVASYTKQLFDTAETVLLMSATVFSEELLCRTLGISQDSVAFIRVAESSFPVENRRIYAMDIVQLNRATLDASLESIAKAVDEIMDRHAGERGVVHTTSYYQANYIIQHVSEHNRERLVTTEGSQARSELLHAHGAKGASVLISPSLYQGVDLKDDLARFQVIVKCLTPDMKILTPEGPRGMTEVSHGSVVLGVDSSGRVIRTRVKNVIVRFHDGKIIRFNDHISVTDNHRVLVRARRVSERRVSPDIAPTFVEAMNVKWGDKLVQAPWGAYLPPSKPVLLHEYADDDAMVLFVPNKKFGYGGPRPKGSAYVKSLTSFADNLISTTQSSRSKGRTTYICRKRDLRRNPAEWTDGEVFIGTYKGTLVPNELDVGDFSELLGWYVSEGNIRNRSLVKLSQSFAVKKTNHERILQLAKDIGCEITRSRPTSVVLWSRPLANALRHFGGQHAKRKCLHPDVFERIDLRRLMEALMLGDGHKRKDNDHQEYYTSSKKLAYNVLETLLRLGHRAVIRTRRKKYHKMVAGVYRAQLSSRLEYTVSIITAKETHISQNPILEHYIGTVWCVETEAGTILAGKDGAFTPMGNCPFPDLSDRRTQVKMQRERGWYDLQTALRLVQTYGRAVRGETDHAATYVLDSNFMSFVNSHRDLFPQYFMDALSGP